MKNEKNNIYKEHLKYNFEMLFLCELGLCFIKLYLFFRIITTVTISLSKTTIKLIDTTIVLLELVNVVSWNPDDKVKQPNLY